MINEARYDETFLAGKSEATLLVRNIGQLCTLDTGKNTGHTGHVAMIRDDVSAVIQRNVHIRDKP